MPRNKGKQEAKLPNGIKKNLQEQQRGRGRTRERSLSISSRDSYSDDEDIRLADIVAIVEGAESWPQLLRNPVLFEFNVYADMLDWLKLLWASRGQDSGASSSATDKKS